MDGQRKALIIANDEYEHDGLQRLLAPAADADALAGVLGNPQIGGFVVEVVRNEPAHLIQERIEDFFYDNRREDVLLLHFSCHGLKSDSGELFFATSNTRPNRLGSTAVSADFVQRCMRASRSGTVVLLLDCCYGGAFARGVNVRAAGDVNVLEAFPVGKLGGGRGRAVITASSAMEYAFEGDRLADERRPQPSVFTAALVEGLATGDADRDEDGWVSLGELYDYIFDKVRERNPSQTPSRDVEMQGDVYLARSRRRRIRGVPIPPDLDAARSDANMFTRLGAVTELRSRLVSDNLPVAVGAFAVLAELAANDIQYIADNAKAALREADIQPSESELNFGQLQQGAPPPRRTVRLLGPPIARACTPELSSDWISVSEVADGFDVSVDTSRAGAMHGELTIKGPTGQATIIIDVDVVPLPAKQASEPEHDATKDQPLPVPSRDRVSAEQPQPHPAASTSHAAQSGQPQAAVSSSPPSGQRPRTRTDAIPPVPEILPAEQWPYSPFAVGDAKYAIGWQYFRAVDGGPSFVTLRRQFGFTKIIDRYPLTQEGWAKAWGSLMTLDQTAAERARRILDRRALLRGGQPRHEAEPAQAAGSAPPAGGEPASHPWPWNPSGH